MSLVLCIDCFDYRNTRDDAIEIADDASDDDAVGLVSLATAPHKPPQSSQSSWVPTTATSACEWTRALEVQDLPQEVDLERWLDDMC